MCGTMYASTSNILTAASRVQVERIKSHPLDQVRRDVAEVFLRWAARSRGRQLAMQRMAPWTPLLPRIEDL